MALPKIDLPTYDINLVSQGATKFRPFTVKEQKILMAGLEAQDLDAAITAVKQVVRNCVQGELDVDSIPMVDLEMLFLAIRAKSMGEKVNLYFKCDQQVPTDTTGNTKPCGMVLEFDVNIEQLDPITLPGKRIQLTDKIVVDMKYPSFALVNLLQKANNTIDAELIVVAGCLDKFYHGDQVIEVETADPVEVIQFLEGLVEEHYSKLVTWVTSVPKIKKTIEKDCPKCNKHHKITLEGLADFFT